jgi:tetratricopeptide (TPR) repeat protein
VVDLVGMADGRPLTIDLPPMPTGQVGFTDLARLADPLASLHDLHGRHGPAGLAPAAARQATRLGAVHNCDMSGQVRAGLYGLAGEWWATAAGMAVDAGDEPAAGRYLRQALWHAAIARDPLLDAHVAHVMATRAAQLGGHREAAAIAVTMLRRAPGTDATRWVAAAGHLHAAAAHAACDGLPLAERALDRALCALRAAGAAWQQPPPWLSRLGTWAVHAGRGRAALTVGRYDLATEHGRQAVAAIPPDQAWDQIHVLLDLAAASLGLREVEHAADHADAALNIAGQLTKPWNRGPVAQRLERLAKEFAAWSEVPRAQEWGTRYRHATAPVTEARTPQRSHQERQKQWTVAQRPQANDRDR